MYFHCMEQSKKSQRIQFNVFFPLKNEGHVGLEQDANEKMLTEYLCLDELFHVFLKSESV